LLGTSLGTVTTGLDTKIVKVEADVSRGLPQFSIVGLPDSAVTESKLRIRSAIRNSGLEFPAQRITVNLSPASVRKHGAGLDLPIAIAILRASGQTPEDMVTQSAFCGELALSGAVVPVDGIVTTALGVHNAGITQFYLSQAQAHQGVSLPPMEWYAVRTLSEVVENLRKPTTRQTLQFSDNLFDDSGSFEDMSEVVGLEPIKRGLAIAAVGRHHTLVVGPPGCGKTMIAQRFPTILPRLSDNDAISVYALWQAAGIAMNPSRIPPLRMPHHSLTVSGLIGGGVTVHPGEVTLAHRGVLVLDELLEFRRHTLDALREPLVHSQIHLARAGQHLVLPADFQLLGTLNPCPCGYYGSAKCHCGERQIRQYWSVLSGPLLDRIDITLSIQNKAPSHTATPRQPTKSSEQIRAEVEAARLLLRARQTGLSHDREGLVLDDFHQEAKDLLEQVVQPLSLTKRGLKSLEKIARSISGLEQHAQVMVSDVQEALSLRSTFSM
jgi:magnesium chelatase family protein